MMIDYEYSGRIYQIIPLNEMIVGECYNGRCRNATLAYWDGEKFIHYRNKFGFIFLEDIKHPENEYRYDVFLPFTLAERNEKVIQLIDACKTRKV